MAEQAGSPGSNADSSATPNKAPASKDKACPFCQQPFTSSSLGRHLDLYIKEKNPKPPDGVHDVAEIRKLRGGITRRQPRTSLRREGSTPAGTPGASNTQNISRRQSPDPEIPKEKSKAQEAPPPYMHRYVPDETPKGGVVTTFFDKPSWQATGVINDIPPISALDSPRRSDEYNHGRDKANGHRVVPKQVLAKSTFDNKQKLTEAQDTARAAELALREVLGSLMAAILRVPPTTTPFEYDPFVLDFPALTLKCLPPPPTLKSVSPVPSPHSWFITPPGRPQFDALRAHFADEIRSWRLAAVIRARNDPEDMAFFTARDFSVTPSASEANYSSIEHIESRASELESSLNAHLNAVYNHWSSLSSHEQTDCWRLELARSVGANADANRTLKSNCEKVIQENNHLRQQVEYLSRCQQPREFQMMPPQTLPLDARTITELSDAGLRPKKHIGLSLADKDEPLHELVSRSISRWKDVVQTGRGANKGMDQQRAFSGVGQNPHLRTTTSIGRNSFGSPRDMEMQDADAEGDVERDIDVSGYYREDSRDGYRGGSSRPAPLAPMGNNPGIRTGLMNGDDGGGYRPGRS